MILDGRLDSRRPRKWIFPRGRTPSSLSLSLCLSSTDGGTEGRTIDGAVCALVPFNGTSRGLYFRVIDITMLERARTKGTRAENTNYNDTRPPPRKQTRCPCINLSVFSERNVWTGRESRLGYFLRGNWSLFLDGPTIYLENGNLVIWFRRASFFPDSKNLII